MEAFFLSLEVLMRLGLRLSWFILLKTQRVLSPTRFTSPSMPENFSQDPRFSLLEPQCSVLQGFSIYLPFLLTD